MGGRHSLVGGKLGSRAVDDHSAGVQDDNPLVQSAGCLHAVRNRQLLQRQPSPSASNMARGMRSRCAQRLRRPSMVVRFVFETPPGVLFPLRTALCTETPHDDMCEAHLEAILLLNGLLHRSEEVVIQVLALSA